MIGQCERAGRGETAVAVARTFGTDKTTHNTTPHHTTQEHKRVGKWSKRLCRVPYQWLDMASKATWCCCRGRVIVVVTAENTRVSLSYLSTFWDSFPSLPRPFPGRPGPQRRRRRWSTRPPTSTARSAAAPMLFRIQFLLVGWQRWLSALVDDTTEFQQQHCQALPHAYSW